MKTLNLYKKIIFFITVILFSVSLPVNEALSLSEYGASCKKNKKCKQCKQDTRCTKCLHKCYNKFDTADSGKYFLPKDPILACRKKRAKWCSAQCWDPDKDRNKPEYITTMPNCHSKTNPNPKR